MTVLSLVKIGWSPLVLGFGMGLGTQEILLISIVVLLVFGPRRIPEVANFIGKAMRQFRKASQEIQDSINQEILRADREKRLRENPPVSYESPYAPAPSAEAGDSPGADGPVAREYYGPAETGGATDAPEGAADAAEATEAAEVQDAAEEARNPDPNDDVRVSDSLESAPGSRERDDADAGTDDEDGRGGPSSSPKDLAG